MKTIIVTGGRSGLGEKIANRLRKDKRSQVYVFDKSHGYDVRERTQMEKFLKTYNIKKVDVLVNNAGINVICPIEKVTKKLWDSVMDTNAYSIVAMTQACLPLMKKGSKIINIISNASRVPMTHSVIYNASKGAAAIMTRQMARELTRGKGIIVIGVSPNKMKGTLMSKQIDKTVCESRGWTMKQAKAYQLQSLVSKKETNPEEIAELIKLIVDNESLYLSGCILEAGY